VTSTDPTMLMRSCLSKAMRGLVHRGHSSRAASTIGQSIDWVIVIRAGASQGRIELMKNLAAVAFAAGLSLVGFSPAQAMSPAPIDTTSGIIIQVAGGCGAGWHRGPYGGCRRNYAPGTVHACPRGYHIGPGGRCRGNGR
jgi:hypothetical protein